MPPSRFFLLPGDEQTPPPRFFSPLGERGPAFLPGDEQTFLPPSPPPDFFAVGCPDVFRLEDERTFCTAKNPRDLVNKPSGGDLRREQRGAFRNEFRCLA